jgi:hypothetical protein
MVRKQFLSTVCLSILSAGGGLILFASAPPAASANQSLSPGGRTAQTEDAQAVPGKLVGQPFDVGEVDISLERFSFWVRGNFEGRTEPMTFTAYVQEWVDSAPVGRILYQSSVQTKAADAEFQKFEFLASELHLKANKEYVVLIAVENFGSSTLLEIRDVEFKASPKLAGDGASGGGGGGGGSVLEALPPFVGQLLGVLFRTRNGSVSPNPSGRVVQVSATAPSPEGKSSSPGSSGSGTGGEADAGSPQNKEPQAVPTPALLPGLLGMGAKLWTQRKAE